MLLAVLGDYERQDCLITVACGQGTHVGKSGVMNGQNWKAVWWRVFLSRRLNTKVSTDRRRNLGLKEQNPESSVTACGFLETPAGFSL